MVALSHFQRGQIVAAHLSGTSATKTATFLRISTEQQFPRLQQHAQIMGRHHQVRGIVARNQK